MDLTGGTQAGEQTALGRRSFSPRVLPAEDAGTSGSPYGVGFLLLLCPSLKKISRKRCPTLPQVWSPHPGLPGHPNLHPSAHYSQGGPGPAEAVPGAGRSSRDTREPSELSLPAQDPWKFP